VCSIDVPGRGWSSPVVWGKQDGDTYVIQAGDEYRLLGQNSIAKMCLAAPAIASGSLFVRTMTKLYRIEVLVRNAG
jgi:hypothetical protein